MLYVVLGMHKSGTTLVSELLHRAGIEMGQGADVDRGYDAGGFFERSDMKALNKRLLDAPVDWRPPRRLAPPSAENRARMRELLSARGTAPRDWGFKDPRTCLTYGIWRSELPPHRIVAVYRALPEVWAHFTRLRERPWAFEIARTWSLYNAGLLAALETAGPDAILLRYERLMAEPTELERLSRFVGRDLVDVRNPQQYRSRARGRLRLAVADALLGAVGAPHPSDVARRLAAKHAASLALP